METYKKLRITTKNQEQVLELLGKYTSKWLLSREEATSVHYHLYFETTTLEATLRLNIRKRFGSGNANYSMKQTEKYPIEYLAYIIKDGEVKWSEGWTEAERKEITEYDQKVKTEMKEKKDKKKKKKQILIEYCAEVKNPMPHLIGPDMIPDILNYHLKKVIEYYQENDLCWNKFRIESDTMYVVSKKFPEYFNEWMFTRTQFI